MSKKDYEAIARAIKEELGPHISPPSRRIIQKLARSLCGIFKADNPNFNRERFLIACGF